MHPSDFTTSLLSVHDLLYRILASETGLASVSSADSQMAAVTAAFDPLREKTLTHLRTPPGPLRVRVFGPLPEKEVPEVVIDPIQNAQAFMGLYKDLAQYLVMNAREHGSDAAPVLAQHVLPLAGRVLFEDPALADAILKQLKAHHAQHGAAVAQRNVRALKNTFRVSPAVLEKLHSE